MKTTISATLHPCCYPSQKAEALNFFRTALENTTGSGKAGPLAGIIAPHIDFRVSLPAHATAFRPLLDRPLPELYLILGVGHRSELEWNLDSRDYLTPLGKASCASQVISRLPPFASPAGHEGEHSIEFPLVWLQAIHELKGATTPVQFVPLLCGGLHEYVNGAKEWEDLHEFHALSRALGRVFTEYPPGDRLQIIVSIDGCHLGPRFDHPFRVTSKLLKATAAWEQELWDWAAAGDARAFLAWMRRERNDRYFDGVGALALLMASGAFRFERTYYEQWFTASDASAVTFSSGLVHLPA